MYSEDYSHFRISDEKIWIVSYNKLATYDDKVTDSLVTKYEFDVKQYGLDHRIFLPKLVVGNKMYLLMDEKIFVLDIPSGKLVLLNLPPEYTISAFFFDGQKVLLRSSNNIISLDPSSLQFTVSKPGTNTDNGDFSKFIKLKNGDVWVTGNRIYKVIDGKKGMESFELLKEGKPFVPWYSSALTEWDKGRLGISKELLLNFSSEIVTKVGSEYRALRNFADAYEWLRRYVNVYVDNNGDSWIAHLNRLDRKISLYHFSKKLKKNLSFLVLSVLAGSVLFLELLKSGMIFGLQAGDA